MMKKILGIRYRPFTLLQFPWHKAPKKVFAYGYAQALLSEKDVCWDFTKEEPAKNSLKVCLYTEICEKGKKEEVEGVSGVISYRKGNKLVLLVHTKELDRSQRRCPFVIFCSTELSSEEITKLVFSFAKQLGRTPLCCEKKLYKALQR